jgi:hypothetical protein
MTDIKQELVAIRKLRTATKDLINDLIKATEETETFDFLFTPVQQLKLPEEDTQSKETPLDYHFKSARPKKHDKRQKPQLTKKMSERITHDYKYKNIEILNEPPEFFKELKNFRNLYPKDFKTPPVKFKQPSKIIPKLKQLKEIESPVFVKGYFIVDKNLQITSAKQPADLKEIERKLLVSIPKDSIKIHQRKRVFNTNDNYNPKDSVSINDHLHAGYVYNTRVKCSKSVSLELESVLNLRRNNNYS